MRRAVFCCARSLARLGPGLHSDVRSDVPPHPGCRWRRGGSRGLCGGCVRGCGFRLPCRAGVQRAHWPTIRAAVCGGGQRARRVGLGLPCHVVGRRTGRFRVIPPCELGPRPSVRARSRVRFRCRLQQGNRSPHGRVSSCSNRTRNRGSRGGCCSKPRQQRMLRRWDGSAGLRQADARHVSSRRPCIPVKETTLEVQGFGLQMQIGV
jgi:hypothetical protein